MINKANVTAYLKMIQDLETKNSPEIEIVNLMFPIYQFQKVGQKLYFIIDKKGNDLFFKDNKTETLVVFNMEDQKYYTLPLTASLKSLTTELPESDAFVLIYSGLEKTTDGNDFKSFIIKKVNGKLLSQTALS